MSLIKAVIAGQLVHLKQGSLSIQKAANQQSTMQCVALGSAPSRGRIGVVRDAATYGARRFNGASSVLSGSLNSTNTDNVTIVAWAKPTATSGTQVVAHNGLASNGYGLRIASGVWQGVVGGAATLSSGVTPDTTRWTMIAFRRTAGTWRILINGVVQGSSISNAPSTPTTMLSVGAARNSGNTAYQDWFSGPIAHVAVFNSAVADADLLRMASGGPGQMGLAIDRVATSATYFPIDGTQSPEPNVQATNSLTVTDARSTVGPPVLSASGTILFSGAITIPGLRGLMGAAVPDTEVNIAAADNYDLVQRRIVVESRPAESMKARFTALMAYLSPFGVTVDPALDTGDSLEAKAYDYMPLADAINDLSAAVTRVFVLDDDLVASLPAPTANPAPADMAEGDPHLLGDITVTPLDGNYRNKIYVKGGDSRVAEVTETFTGDGVASSFPLRYPFVSGRGYVTVSTGGSHAETLGVGAQWVIDAGSLKRNAGVFPLHDTVTIVHDAQFPIVVSAQNATEVANQGLFEDRLDLPSEFDIDALQAAAEQAVAIGITAQREVMYPTDLHGLEPGMQQHVTAPSRDGFDADCIITAVTVKDHAGDVHYDVTAVTGLNLTTWQEPIQRWNGSGNGTGLSAIGGATLVQSTGASATDGNLLAQRDSDNEVEVGLIDGLTGIDVPVPGLRIGRRPGASGNHAWDVLNRISSDARYRELAFFDNYQGDGNGVALALFYWASLGGYVLGPSSRSSAFSGGLQLGLDSLGKRLVAGYFQGEVATIAGLRERGRTTKLGEWTTYTPTWTGSGSNPSLGNGTLAARYVLIGKTAMIGIRVVMGSTTTFGSGNWLFSPPVTLASNSGYEACLGAATCFDNGTNVRTGSAALSGGNLTGYVDSETNFIGALRPFTWASGDTLTLLATCEIA